MPGRLTIIRHGSTALNDADRIRGWKDVPLNAKGIKEAMILSGKMIGAKIDRIHSSDLERAVHTAAHINKHHDAPMTLHQELRPWNVGTFAGEKRALVFPKMKVLQRQMHERIPAPGGESFRDFKDRYLPFLRSKMREARETGKHIVLAAHYRNLSAAEAWIAKGMPHDHSLDLKIMDNHNFSKPSDIYEISEADLRKA